MIRNNRGISLVEILAVLTIASLLAGLAFAGWQRAIEAARTSACLANLRAIGAASAEYSADNDGRLPATAHQRASWIGTLQPYLGTKRPYRCPLDRNLRRVASYALNDALANPAFSRRVSIARPAETMFMAETSDRFDGGDHFHFLDEETGELVAAGAAEQFPAHRHGRGSNFLFVDGHIETLSPRELAPRLGAASAFLNPAP